MTDYDFVVSEYFWGALYSQGGWSLYCGYQFGKDRKTKDGKVIDVGHIYPLQWIIDSVDCESRLQCFEKNNTNFLKMESDLHNMYPVWYELVTLINNRAFGEVSGEQWRFSDCDYEWGMKQSEPREIARGNIARAIFYMHDTYGATVDPDMLAMLKVWNRRDPPSKQEKYRNDRIETLQGRRNPYIDDPSLAKGIGVSARR